MLQTVKTAEALACLSLLAKTSNVYGHVRFAGNVIRDRHRPRSFLPSF